MCIFLRHPTDFPYRAATLLAALLIVLIAAPLAGAGGKEALEPDDDPMASFARLVGGRWVLDDTYHTFDWGVGQKTILARSYARSGDDEELTAEARWFWHPAKKAIQGFTIALGMPFELLESRTRFEENTMVNELTATDSGGGVSEYVETMEFVDDNRYLWTLYQDTSDGRQQLMSGTFTRVN